ncbi:MAG: rhodanese-like domain-containing protein, partial [Flavobacteriaceae bacterium]|nr:rhodanese-like domain-containing protein [Flavobacteriaceae bacterium]
RIGYENIIGYTNGVEDWEKENQKVDTISSIYSSSIKEYMIDSIFLDVRNNNELESGYIKDSINIPLNNLNQKIKDSEKENELFLYCQTGYRSMIASSLLKIEGYKNVNDIDGGFVALKSYGTKTFSSKNLIKENS